MAAQIKRALKCCEKLALLTEFQSILKKPRIKMIPSGLWGLATVFIKIPIRGRPF